jgi:hypothetical protein
MTEVLKAVQRLNQQWFLPGIQREFVWNEREIARLFDSLIREFPIGAITMWDVNAKESAKDYNSYKFIHKYINNSGDIPDDIDDRISKQSEGKSEVWRRYNQSVDPDICNYLIIDGQQRLTSLIIGLTGSTLKYAGGSGRKKSNSDYWEVCKLCVNVLGHPEYKSEDVEGDYEFKFKRVRALTGNKFDSENQTEYEYTEDETKKYWIPLNYFLTVGGGSMGKVKRSKVRNEIEEEIEGIEVSDGEIDAEDIVTLVIDDVFTRILEGNVVEDTAEGSPEYISEVFKRMNMQGRNPTPYQLLISRTMSHWPYSDSPVNTREKLEGNDSMTGYIDRFKNKYPSYETEVGRKLFMRYSCYLIGADLRKKRVENMDAEELRWMRKKWLGPKSDTDHRKFQNALENAMDAITEIGFTSRSMESMSMVALIGKFFYENGDAKVDEKNRGKIGQFLAKCILLNTTYGILRRSKASDMAEKLTKCYDQTNTNKGESVVDYSDFIDGSLRYFPGDDVLNEMNFNITREVIERAVHEGRYEKQEGDKIFTSEDVAAILSLLMNKEQVKDLRGYEVDHIYPQSKKDDIEESVGKEIDIHRIGNLQLLKSNVNNNEKDDLIPNEWINKLNDSEFQKYRKNNQYPDDWEGEKSEYDDFVSKREDLIIESLCDYYIS